MRHTCTCWRSGWGHHGNKILGVLSLGLIGFEGTLSRTWAYWQLAGKCWPAPAPKIARNGYWFKSARWLIGPRSAREELQTQAGFCVFNQLGLGQEARALHRVMLPWGCCGALTDTLLHSTRTVSRGMLGNVSQMATFHYVVTQMRVFLQPWGLSFFCLCFVGAEVILRNWHIMLLPPNAAIRLDFDGSSQVGANDVRNITSWRCAPWEVSLQKGFDKL